MTKQQSKRHPLEQLRFDRDWSYSRLAEEIEATTGVRRSEPTWQRICKRRITPTDRTKDAMDRFLAAQSSTGASR